MWKALTGMFHIFPRVTFLAISLLYLLFPVISLPYSTLQKYYHNIRQKRHSGRRKSDNISATLNK